MNKKRGQITVFLILGVVLVFIVIAVILLSVTIQKTTLERKHQEIAQRLLQKEALRIYVDEELPDIIDDFLITFGKQGGKVYDDQGGSARRDIFIGSNDPPEVSSPPTSIEYALAGEMLQVGYGIRYEKDTTYDESHLQGNKYPCAPCLIENCGSGGDPPRFCAYRYPQRRGADGNIVRFGRLELPRLGEVERQLAGYLQKQLVGFIQEFIDQKVKLDVQVIPSSEDPEIDVFFESERVRVTVKYPLILRYQGEDIAALADFSFTQETQFKKYYEAMRELFQYDVDYMDFQLTSEKIPEYRETKFPFQLQYNPNDNQPTYCQDLDGDGISTCELSLKYTFVPDMEMAGPEPVGADNVFIFRVPAGRIVRDRPYTFVVARQNRPPVVDYIVPRDGSGEYVVLGYAPGSYDYLVIPNHETYGTIDFTVQARDADTYVPGENDPAIHFSLENDHPDILQLQQADNRIFSTAVIDPVIKSFRIRVNDEQGLSDSQEIRVLASEQALPIQCPRSADSCAVRVNGEFVQGNCREGADGLFCYAEQPDNAENP